MIAVPEGITVERSERNSEMRVRCRLLVESQDAQPTNVGRYFSFDALRDRMERDVLLGLKKELLRMADEITVAIDKESNQ